MDCFYHQIVFACGGAEVMMEITGKYVLSPVGMK